MHSSDTHLLPFFFFIQNPVHMSLKRYIQHLACIYSYIKKFGMHSSSLMFIKCIIKHDNRSIDRKKLYSVVPFGLSSYMKYRIRLRRNYSPWAGIILKQIQLWNVAIHISSFQSYANASFNRQLFKHFYFLSDHYAKVTIIYTSAFPLNFDCM